MSGGVADRIDLGRLEKELVSAVEADRRYSRENDAKFRAVNQKVATYEEFRWRLGISFKREEGVRDQIE